ncbi:MAG: glycosyltransferase family 2 protein [Frankiaceae bacterium]|nr:glycosyltransferase family 2 protein [Frankiaceae bacterium]MBV9870277.1 glycosyltransferase family 2 protein [Frankiaceae bacterium]
MKTEPDGQTPRVSVVIPTYNRADLCARLLRTLADQTIGCDAFEVIVVDDCSNDDTTDVLKALVPELPYRLRPMRTAANGGAGPARNLGWPTAQAPIVAFTDDDCVPAPNWLEAGVAAFTDKPHVGLVQGRTLASNFDMVHSVRWAHAVIVDGPNSFFETCNIFYRRQAIEDAGGFGEDFNWWSSPAWCEDTLAGWSALDAGWESAFAPDAVVSHDVDTRSLKWWVKTSLSQYREVAIAKRFPAYREQTFWRPWAPRRHDAAFVAAAVGAIAATRWRPAVLAAVPYLVWRRPSVSQGQFARGCVETVIIDSARTAGNLIGSVRSRTLVL